MTTKPEYDFDNPHDIQLATARDGNAFAKPSAAAKVRADAKAQMATISANAEKLGRPGRLLASEQRNYDKSAELVAEMDDVIAHCEFMNEQRRGVMPPSGNEPRAYVKDRPLAEGQTVLGAVVNLDLDRRDSTPRHELEEPGAFTNTIRNAMSGGTGGAGGFALPTILTADLIDLARNKARVLQAGARVVPMANRTVDVPRWVTDPAPEWRAENDPVTEDDGAIDKITLTAHSLAVVTKISRELVEDTDLEVDLKAAFAAAFALEIDRAALYGTGADDQPTGVKNNSGVTKTPMAANGAVPTWDALVESVGRLRDVNEEPNAQILSDRTARYLSLVKETGTGAYLRPPEYLDGVERYTTGQVPNNLVVGTSGATTSDVFTADWSQLYLGVRTALQITLLCERYMVDAGQYGFVAWWRGDVQVARPKAFDVVTGIKPS